MTETSSFVLNTDQAWIIISMHSLGYLADERGVCDGVSTALLMPMLTDQTEIITKPLEKVYLLYTSAYEETLLEMPETNSNDNVPLPPSDQDKEFIEKKIKSIKEKFLNKFNSLHFDEQLIIKGIFDAIEMKYKKPALIPTKNNYTVIDHEQMQNIIAPDCLQQHQGIKIIETTRITLNKDQLKQFLFMFKHGLANITENNNLQSVTFLIYSEELKHIIVTKYNSLKRFWESLDINQFPKLPIEKYLNINAVSNHVFHSFSKKETNIDFTIDTTVLADSSIEFQQAVIKTLQFTKLYLSICDLSKEIVSCKSRELALEALEKSTLEAIEKNTVSNESFSQLNERYELFKNVDKFFQLSNNGYYQSFAISEERIKNFINRLFTIYEMFTNKDCPVNVIQKSYNEASEWFFSDESPNINNTSVTKFGMFTSSMTWGFTKAVEFISPLFKQNK